MDHLGPFFSQRQSSQPCHLRPPLASSEGSFLFVLYFFIIIAKLNIHNHLFTWHENINQKKKIFDVFCKLLAPYFEIGGSENSLRVCSKWQKCTKFSEEKRKNNRCSKRIFGALKFFQSMKVNHGMCLFSTSLLLPPNYLENKRVTGQSDFSPGDFQNSKSNLLM